MPLSAQLGLQPGPEGLLERVQYEGERPPGWLGGLAVALDGVVALQPEVTEW